MSIFGRGPWNHTVDYIAYIPHPVIGANANNSTQ